VLISTQLLLKQYADSYRAAYLDPLAQFEVDNPRLLGGVQAFNGAGELIGAGTFLFAGKGAGYVALLPAMGYGADQFWAGAKTVFTGEPQETGFQYFLSDGLGLDSKDVFAVDFATGTVVDLLGAKPLAFKPKEFVSVVRWGKTGALEPGDWVMVGKKNWLNYFLSFKWEPSLGTNKWASFGIGEQFDNIPASAVKWPTGKGIDGRWKGIFGQRKYEP
jgi:hypothetical protein